MFCRMNRYGLNRRWLLVLLCGLLAPLGTRGAIRYRINDGLQGETLMEEAPADTTRTDNSESDSAYSLRINFNPLDYQLQKRYINKGEKFKTRPFYERAYIGLYTGVQQIAPKGDRELKSAIPLAGFLGYDFNRLHSLRLSGVYNAYGVKGTGWKIKQIGMDLDYFFNVSSYLYGYNPRRIFEVSGFIGGGAIETHLNGNVNRVLKGQVGAHLSFRTAGNTALFIEPFMGIATDGVDHSGGSNPSIYDVIYGVRAGCALHLRSSGDFFKGTVYNGSLFFDFSQGAAMSYSKGGMPILKTMGTMYQVAMGKWLNPVLGLRASISVSDYYWQQSVSRKMAFKDGRAHPAYETRYKSYLFTGRIEGMLNPVHFSSRWRKTPHMFDLNLLLGGEYGWMSKPYMKNSGKAEQFYKGVTGAMQLLYNVTPNTSLYVEPRALLAMYDMSYDKNSPKKSYIDKIGYISAGVRLMYPTKAQRATFEKSHFEPFLFVGGQLGGIRQIRSVKTFGAGNPGMMGAVSVGYQYAPLAAAKFQLEYMVVNKNMGTPYEAQVNGQTRRYSALWRNRYGYMNMKVAYMLNLNNLYQKYDASRRLNLYAQAGPLLAVRVKQGAKLYGKETVIGDHLKPILKKGPKKSTLGLFGGMILDYRILDSWSVYAEPEVQWFSDINFPVYEKVPANASFLGRWAGTFVLKFSLGATYRF